MRTEDFQHPDVGEYLDTDLCIVGGGPAGLTVAKEFFGTTIEALIIESGGLAPEAHSDALREIESIGWPRRMEPTQTRNRIFGGTSHSWSGRCAPFDEIDFEARNWVPYSGWPISRRELHQYFKRAAPFLGLRHVCYDDHLWNLFSHRTSKPDLDPAKFRSVFWQFSRDDAEPREFMRFGRRFLAEKAANVRVLLHASVTQIIPDASGSRLKSIEIASPQGKRALVQCKALVLCAGGIENARLLLCSNRIIKNGIGNRYDMVGRFLMDHPRPTLGEFEVTEFRLREKYGPNRIGSKRSGHFFLPGLALSPEYQRKMGLLNCAAWLEEHRALDDPFDAAKRFITRRNGRSLSDLAKALCQPRLISQGLYDRVSGERVKHKLLTLVLKCILEQRPDPASRIRLSDRIDSLGMPLAQLDWKVSHQERETASALGKLIASEFKRIGLPSPNLAEWVQAGRFEEAQFIDVAHPTGTTRMSSSPDAGVVDKNCHIHGFDGVYIAGSSVFPTSGHANPTFMIVALAIRLADWLKPRLLASKRAYCPSTARAENGASSETEPAEQQARSHPWLDQKSDQIQSKPQPHQPSSRMQPLALRRHWLTILAF
jgi:choline dehydrogenase-like flavoprotein